MSDLSGPNSRHFIPTTVLPENTSKYGLWYEPVTYEILFFRLIRFVLEEFSSYMACKTRHALNSTINVWMSFPVKWSGSWPNFEQDWIGTNKFLLDEFSIKTVWSLAYFVRAPGSEFLSLKEFDLTQPGFYIYFTESTWGKSYWQLLPINLYCFLPLWIGLELLKMFDKRLSVMGNM